MYKIALIDDDQFALDGMKKMIQWEALNAEWAGEGIDGEQGLELIHRTKPDIVITDIYMPVMNGLEMIETLQSERTRCKVIVLSGYSDFEYARQALRLQVSDYLSKPISRQSLNQALEQSIRELDEDKRRQGEIVELNRKLSTYEPFVEMEWLKSLLTGTYPGGGIDMSAILQQGGAARSGFTYAMLGIEITSTKCFTTLSEWDLYRFALGNIMKEILQQEWGNSWFTELHSYYFAVMLLVPEELHEKEFQELVSQLSRRLSTGVKSYLKLQIHIGLGLRKSRWQDVHRSMEEAFYALSVKQAGCSVNSHLYLYVDESSSASAGGSKDQALVSPYRFYSLLSQEIRMGNIEKAKRILQDFFETLQGPETSPLPSDYLVMLGMELWTVIGYVLYDIGILLDSLFPKEQIEQEIRMLADQAGLKDWLSEKITALYLHHCKSKARHKQLIDFTLNYIRVHYNEDLSITDLGSKVYISPYYLSQIFKKTTGESFNHYLNKIRVEKAKEMLVEGKYMIYEIAEKVGCKNVSYFCTLFKKYTGTNPSDFYR